jgi:hypothetical protein
MHYSFARSVLGDVTHTQDVPPPPLLLLLLLLPLLLLFVHSPS